MWLHCLVYLFCFSFRFREMLSSDIPFYYKCVYKMYCYMFRILRTCLKKVSFQDVPCVYKPHFQDFVPGLFAVAVRADSPIHGSVPGVLSLTLLLIVGLKNKVR